TLDPYHYRPFNGQSTTNMRTPLAIVAFCLILLHSIVSSEFPVVQTSFGHVRGYPFTSKDGTSAQIFKRIPYASAPIGELRWKKPAALQSWNETLDCTFFGPACAQRTVLYSGPPAGFSEDCLYLNVYTSDECMSSNVLCPVLFVIHGGVAIYEAPMKFPDETLVRNFVSQGIVVVTIAYRLGAFGVIALGDENVLPANLAFHDVLAALKFTRAEVAKFGGDVERITLMGHSEGAHFALMAAFSPAISKHGEPRLFNGVISMSGPSGLESQELTVNRTQKVAKELGCTGTAHEVLTCLKQFDTDSILGAAFKVHGPNVFSAKGPIGVTMAGELLPITNARELRQNTAPIRLMMGTTIYEIRTFVERNKLNRMLGIVNDEECYEKYLRDKQTGQFKPGYNDDSQAIIMTSHLFTKYIAELGGEAYLYEYDYPVHGAHADDAYFVLGFHEFEKDENEEWLSRVYPRYFANFVKGGRPAPDWNPVKPQLMNYYSVNKSIADDISPHTKYGYQSNIVRYYDELVKFDDVLFKVKNKVLSAPIEYKSLNFSGNFQSFLESLTITDAIVFFCFFIAVICFLCCLCKCFQRFCCCCCRRKRGCEHQPLIIRQYPM
ncbi:hypothetical protein PFISCL1PPCAC_27133, partial [Pristionchus fissidentatus]